MYDAEHTPAGTLRSEWWVVLTLGIISLVAGLFALTWPFISGLAFTQVFGIVLLVAAVVQLVHTVRLRKGAWSIILGLFGTLLYAAAGLILLAYPVRGLMVATFVLGTMFTVQGIFQVAGALDRVGRAGWGWLLVGGLLTFILGIIILAELPTSALWALGTIIGVNLIFLGIALITESASLHALTGPRLATQGG